MDTSEVSTEKDDEMPRAYTKHEAYQKVTEAAREIGASISPYKYTIASETYVPLCCQMCGHVWSSLFGNLVNHKKGCPSCAGNLPIPQKIAEERVTEALNMLGFNFAPFEYSTSKKTRIALTCTNCGTAKKNLVTYDSIVSGKTGCNVCSGVERLTKEQARKKLNTKLCEKHISFADFNWDTAKNTRIDCKCLLCGYAWDASFSNLMYGSTGCPSCAGNLKISHEEKCERLFECAAQKNLQFLEPIAEANLKDTKTKTKCLTCNYRWYPSYHSLIYQGSGCPNCANVAPITQEVADATVSEACTRKNIELVNPFVMQGIHETRLSLKCISCTHHWRPTYAKFLGRDSGCPKCAGRYSPTQEEAYEEVVELCNSINAELKGPFIYEGVHETFVTIECMECRHEWEPSYANLKYHGSGCPACAGNVPTTQQEAEQEVKTALDTIGCSLTKGFKFIGANATYLELSCNECTYEYDVVYSSLVYRNSGCARCAGILPLTQEEASERVNEVCERSGYISFPFIYNNQKTRVPLKCMNCEGEWSPTFLNLVANKRGCPNCAKYGFKPDLPAILYYASVDSEALTIPQEKLFKIGITNLTFDERFSRDRDIISPILVWEFDIGEVAREFERKILQENSENRIKNVKILKSHGNTELFEIDIIKSVLQILDA